jgi:histidinol phosphatase-like enzyme
MTDKQLAAYAKVKILWARMCRAEGIDPSTKFVMFSPSNPVQAEYNAAMAAYQTLMAGGR